MSREKSSQAEPEHYLERNLHGKIARVLSDTPVVCLLGPRQCGKSTLAAHLDPERRFVSLDNLTYLQLAQEDPQGFLDSLPEFVTIDEVQRVPGLFLAIKRSVDQDRRAGRFLLTGSANLYQLPQMADSLAGRMETLRLHPLAESEKAQAPGDFLRTWLAGELAPALSNRPPPPPIRTAVPFAAGRFSRGGAT